jgi:YD repeat-containing protein
MFWRNGLDAAKRPLGYDALERLIGERLTIAGTPYTLNYTYDSANRRIAEKYPNGQDVERNYTPRDQLQSVSFGGQSVLTSVSYDLGGREVTRRLGTVNLREQTRSWRGALLSGHCQSFRT